MATDFKQYDPQWEYHPYAGENMRAAGCGPTSVADLLNISPVTVADWMQANGYASNGQGSYWSGIPAAIQHWGYQCSQLNYSSLRGYTVHSAFETFKASIQAGNMGILLMHTGVTVSGLVNYWTGGGHFIAIVSYRASDNKYQVYDPANHGRCGWHGWNDFAGEVGVLYTTNIKWGKGTTSTSTTTTTTTTSTFKTKGTAICTEDNVNIRQTPGGTIIGTANKGNRFEVDGTVTNDYVHIKIATVGVGYMHKDYVKYDQTAPAPTPAPQPTTTTSTSKPNTATVYSFNPHTIGIGSDGNDVLLLQEILKAKGLYIGLLDKDFGPQTDDAVKKYQKMRNLAVDGVCGPMTWKDLLGM